MTDTPSDNAPAPLSWHRDDLECRLGFQGGRYTQTRILLWLIAAGVLTAGFYGLMSFYPRAYLVQVFTQRGPVQYIIVFFFFWSLLMLLAKASKARHQRRALAVTDVVPEEADFVLSPAQADPVLRRLAARCEDPRKFILFNRIEMALSKMKNMGSVAELESVLKTQAENDEDVVDSSYVLLRGLVWSIPVLGFIGTVQGLSLAIGGFSDVLAVTSELEALRTELQDVTGGLATAFETTLVALVAALIIQLLMTIVRKGEEELLDACKEYCQRHVVSRIRLTPFETAA
ncbi:MAG: MotA/TolQ/ExbB proton channel family protein [Phycisphaeraceae bacterium]